MFNILRILVELYQFPQMREILKECHYTFKGILKNHIMIYMFQIY